MHSLHHLREEYSLKQFTIDDADSNPFNQFRVWFSEAMESKIKEPNAMHLATIDSALKPTIRVVLLKEVTDGFVFFTNFESRKGKNLVDNPNACLNFFWAELERQIRIEGKVVKIGEKESALYFESRPKGSKIGAWTSPQSMEIPNHRYLEEKYQVFEKQFEGDNIPKPAHWGGFKLIPEYFEFWQGQRNRLHRRIFYKMENENWRKGILAP